MGLSGSPRFTHKWQKFCNRTRYGGASSNLQSVVLTASHRFSKFKNSFTSEQLHLFTKMKRSVWHVLAGVQVCRNMQFYPQNPIKTRWGSSKNEVGLPFFRSKFRVATSTSISGMSVVAVGWWLVLGHSDQQIWSSEKNDARDGNIWRLPPRHRPRFQTTTYDSETSKLPCWRCQLFVSCKVRKTRISQTLKLQSENHLVIFELVVEALLSWE